MTEAAAGRRRPRSPATRLLLAAAPFAGAAAVLALLFLRIPPERVAAALAGADLPRFFAALLPVSLLYVVLDTGLLTTVLSWFHPPGLRFRETLAVRAVDYLVTLWNGRASQAAMVGALGRRLGRRGEVEVGGGAPYWRLAGTILFLDLCQRGHLLLWAGLGALALGERSPGRIPAALAVGIAAAVLFVAFFRGKLRAAGLGPPRWRLLRTFRSAAPRHYLLVLAWKAPLIVAAAAGHSLALGAFGVDIGALQLLATLPIIFLAGALPIAVARVGTAQAAWVYFHAPEAAASPGGEAGLLAYSLAAHFTFLLTNALLTTPFLPAAWRMIRNGPGGVPQ